MHTHNVEQQVVEEAHTMRYIHTLLHGYDLRSEPVRGAARICVVCTAAQVSRAALALP